MDDKDKGKRTMNLRSKKHLTLLAAGLGIALIAIILMAYQTSLHKTYIRKALSEINLKTDWKAELVEMNTGLISSEAITSIEAPGYNNGRINMHHTLLAYPIIKTKVKSRFDLTDPATAKFVRSLRNYELETMVVSSEVSLSKVLIQTSLEKIGENSGSNLRLKDIAVKIFIEPQDSSSAYLVDSTVDVDSISTTVENNTEIVLDAVSIKTSTHVDDSYVNDSMMMFGLEKAAVTSKRSGHQIKLDNFQFVNTLTTKEFMSIDGNFSLDSLSINNSIIENFNGEILVSRLDSSSAERFMQSLTRMSTNSSPESFVGLIGGGLGIFSKKPEFKIQNLQAKINSSQIQFSGSTTLVNLQKILDLGLSADALDSIRLEADLSADQNIYDAIAKLSFDIENFGSSTTRSPNVSEIEKRTEMVKKQIMDSEVLEIAPTGLKFNVKVENGDVYHNGNIIFSSPKQDQVRKLQWPKTYKNAHLTAVNAQRLLQNKKYDEALRYYEIAREEMEHPNVRADKGEDSYINYGFVMNDIGVIHLGWALYGKKMNTDVSYIDLNEIDKTELSKAREALNKSIEFYKRWFEHNENDYERFANAIAETYANLGTALKYSGEQEKALEAFRLSLLRNPDNFTAKRGLEMLDINPTPYIEAGEQEKKKHKIRKN